MLQQLRRVLFSSTAIWLYVAINAAVFVAIASWIFTDSRFGEAAARLGSQFRSPLEFDNESINDIQLGESVLRMKVLVIVALVSGLLYCGAAIFGPPRNRRIHSWLGLMFVTAVWLTLWATWSDLMWSGQIFRLKRATSSFQTLAKSLDNAWPTVDGSRDDIGPFNAYPVGQPNVLQLLTERDSTSGGTTFSQIERLENGAFSFKLTGRDLGAWLEWHPSHDLPRSFVGGLAQMHALDRFAPLGDDWFLVRYE